MKTFSATPSDIHHEWLIVDAQDVPLGRLASAVAQLIRGKHKPTYTPHMDVGDFVIVINAEKVRLTGKKLELPIKKILQGADPTSVVSREAMANPDSLDDFLHYAQGHAT